MTELQPPSPEQRAEYDRLAHAIQSGVAMELVQSASPGSPKHLRVGVNLRAVTEAAIVRLLVENGLITSDQFYEALNRQMAEEVALHEHRLSQQYGRPVTLA